MEKSSAVLLLSLFASISSLAAQEPVIALRAGRLIDGKSDKVTTGVIILVQGNRIREVGTNISIPPEAQTVDLGAATVLPGLIDAHTHVLLQGDITSAEYEEQIYKSPHRTAPFAPWRPCARL
jgi:imidazolonepropionase-like amidohydrolase